MYVYVCVGERGWEEGREGRKEGEEGREGGRGGRKRLRVKWSVWCVVPSIYMCTVYS